MPAIDMPASKSGNAILFVHAIYEFPPSRLYKILIAVFAGINACHEIKELRTIFAASMLYDGLTR